jgi:predicted DCC family thiol-disulfide oxidoreductase YuxK
MELPEHLVLIDGSCNLCHGSVQFIERNSKNLPFFYTSIQSVTGQQVRDQFHIRGDLYSILYLEHGKLYERSDAALRIARYLDRPWRWLALLKFVPRPIRNLVYNFIASNRYRWFGKKSECMLPDISLRHRLLD